MPLSKLNYLDIGPGGTFNPSGNPGYDSIPQDVDDLFDDLQAKDQKKILLYFHGGLVGEEDAMSSAILITEKLINETDVHPIAFIWETDLLSTIKQNLGNITSSDFFKKLLEKVIKVAGDKLGLDVNTLVGKRGIGNLTDAEIQLELQKEAPFENYTQNAATRSVNILSGDDNTLRDEIEASIQDEIAGDPDFSSALIASLTPAQLHLINQDKVISVPRPGQRGILSLAKIITAAITVIFKVIKRFVNKRDHGFYPTVMEEIFREVYIADIGTTLWGFMKTKANDMWLPDPAGTTGLDQHAGRYLLSQLKTYSGANPGVTIDLVGHSAGAIAICNFLREFLDMGIDAKVRNIIFMAPACRSDLFADTIGQHPDAFQNFRMFTMSDQYECLDRCVPYVYTRSLLYMISGILEKDEFDAYILGMQRYLSGNPPYAADPKLQANINFMAAPPNRIVYAVTAAGAAPGLQCTAQHHGDFHDDQYLTMDSIVYILNH